jgi:AcrR family transcriptional regulator
VSRAEGAARAHAPPDHGDGPPGTASTPDPSTPEGPTTRRGRATRAAVLRAARQVFEERGFFDARVADIVERAGVAHGTFYTYFDSKEAAFREVVDEVAQDIYSAMHDRPPPSTDPVARIRAAHRAYLAAHARNARILLIVEQVTTYNREFLAMRRNVRNRFVERAARGIRRLQEQGVADRRLDAGVAASALGSMVEHFAFVWLTLGEPYDEDVAVETLTRLWAHGIGLRLPDDP